jgi:hypothetical protein
MCIKEDFPMAYHTMAEILHFNLLNLDNTSIVLYNLTSKERKCEVSVQFYAKSVLRGYLKTWLQLAEKRYLLQDYEGAYLLYAYSAFLGLHQGAFSAGYAWEKHKTGSFKCAL